MRCVYWRLLSHGVGKKRENPLLGSALPDVEHPPPPEEPAALPEGSTLKIAQASYDRRPPVTKIGAQIVTLTLPQLLRVAQVMSDFCIQAELHDRKRAKKVNESIRRAASKPPAQAHLAKANVSQLVRAMCRKLKVDTIPEKFLTKEVLNEDHT